jgi:hypothetical protein
MQGTPHVLALTTVCVTLSAVATAGAVGSDSGSATQMSSAQAAPLADAGSVHTTTGLGGGCLNGPPANFIDCNIYVAQQYVYARGNNLVG